MQIPPFPLPPVFRAATLQKCGSKFFSVFLCQRCREIWREILVKFSVLRFPGFGCARENFTKISRQKWCEKTENFTQISLCWGAALTLFNLPDTCVYARVLAVPLQLQDGKWIRTKVCEYVQRALLPSVPKLPHYCNTAPSFGQFILDAVT